MGVPHAGRGVLSRATPRLLPAFRAGALGLAMVLLAPASERVAAQSRVGLVVLGTPESERAVRRALETVVWPHGPRELVVTMAGADLDWDAVRRATGPDRAGSAVIVPLAPVATPDRRRAAELPFPIRITDPVAAPWESDAGLAREIEWRAADGLARLAGRLTRPPALLAELTVTASRAERIAFAAPAGVTALGTEAIRRRDPRNAADLFRDLPGLDVDGVGTSQQRTVIRGLSGQRVLLLEDGLRVNNARREQGVDEPPAMFPVHDLERIEVVRGAMSVLYGSDAIGGVVNLVGMGPPGGSAGPAQIEARVGTTYRSADRQAQVYGAASGRVNRLGFRASATWREASPYSAPAGTFGDVTLAQRARVHDTGVRDHQMSLAASYALGAAHQLTLKGQRYRATDAGLGYVAPEDLGVPAATVQLLYPDRSFARLALTYRGLALAAPLADRVEASVFVQDNDRSLVSNVSRSLGGGGHLRSRSENVTGVTSVGLRVEARKALAGGHLLTWGLDAHRDGSRNSDTATTVVTGPSGTSVSGRGRPQVPYANLRSVGLFAQAELATGRRATVTLGARLQDVRAASEATPRLSEPLYRDRDRGVAAAASLVYRLTRNLNLVAGAGRAFRSPNLVERFFTGVSPEGSTFWRYNPEIAAETSLDLQAGLRFLSRHARLEAYGFRNAIHDGIRRVTTGDSVNGLPEARYANVDALRYAGIEVGADVDLAPGLGLLGHYTRVWTTNVGDRSLPLGDSYASKLVGTLRYGAVGGRWWIEYQTRHHGRRADAELGRSVVGSVIPAFTVHAARGGLAVATRYRMGLAVDNLFDVLYAEAPNTAFFRPEPGRSLTLSITAEF